MASAKTKSSLASAATQSVDWGTRLTQVAFLWALVVVCARAMMLESLRDPFDPLPGGEAAPRIIGPASSLLLDLLCCAPALLVLGRRLIDPTYVIRWSWSHLAMGALAAWMALSVAWAGDKFAALVQAASFISALVLLWSATQLVRSWGRLRLVAAAAFGIFLIYIAAGLEYRLIDLPEMRENYRQNQEKILKERNLEPGTFAARQFELKVMGGDVGCFTNSPNTYAAALVLMGMVAAGVLAQRLSNREHLGWSLATAAAFPLAGIVLYFTHSRTGMATVGLGLALLVGVRVLGHWLAARARLAYALGAGAFLLGTLAVVGHGLAHGNLVEKSLTFRWYYWTGAARLAKENPLTGVGWANFGQRYLQVRLPQATEEVQDPHNLFIRALAELGVLGGLLMAGWMALLWWELTRPLLPPPTPVGTRQPRQRTVLRLGVLSAGAAGLTFLFSADWAQPGAYLSLQALRQLLAAFLLLLGFCIIALESLMNETLDERPSPWVLYGILVGLGVFLLHNLIDFSLFETAPMFVFALLAGSALGLRQPSLAGRRRHTRALQFAAAAAGLLTIGAMMLWATTALAEEEAARGDTALRAGRFEQAAGHYGAAFRWQRLNGDYAFRAAQALAWQKASRSYVHGMLENASQANPYAVKYRRFRAAYELEQPDPNRAIIDRAFTKALELDPRNVALRLAYAQALTKLADPAKAAEQFRQALHHDAQLPEAEPKRLTPQQRQAIEKKIGPP